MTFKLYSRIFLNGDGSFERFIEMIKLPYLFGKLELLRFISDMAVVLKGHPYDLDLASAQRNWTIGSSIGFSLSYIIAVVFLMATKRSLAFRAGIARILQRLIEHPRGPLGALSLLFAGLLFIAKFYV